MLETSWVGAGGDTSIKTEILLLLPFCSNDSAIFSFPHLEIYGEMSTHCHVCPWLEVLEPEAAYRSPIGQTRRAKKALKWHYEIDEQRASCSGRQY